MNQAVHKTLPSPGVIDASKYKRPADALRAETIQKQTLKRNHKLVLRFDELYNKKRLRYDDVINQLSDEFCVGTSRVEKVLKKPGF